MADDYRDYVSARLDGFRRTAFLMCGDWHLADDLVSTALLKLLRHWRRVSAMDDPDAYVRRVLLRCLLDERRRPWRREAVWEWPPERGVEGVDGPVTDRIAVLAALAELPPRRRAVVVLRYFCDLSVEQTAAELGCTPGTVKSQTARALDSMRLLRPSRHRRRACTSRCPVTFPTGNRLPCNRCPKRPRRRPSG